jgi:Protein of unknown function (DUF4233)
MRRLCATVLIMEAVMIGLAIPVAITIAHARPATAGIIGGVLGGAAILLAAVGRPGQRWALAGGSVLQAAVIATGVVVPVMYGLGAIFAGLWVTAIWLARRYQVP